MAGRARVSWLSARSASGDAGVPLAVPARWSCRSIWVVIWACTAGLRGRVLSAAVNPLADSSVPSAQAVSWTAGVSRTVRVRHAALIHWRGRGPRRPRGGGGGARHRRGGRGPPGGGGPGRGPLFLPLVTSGRVAQL